MNIELLVNGERSSLQVEPGRTLLEVLREELRLTGTHEYCSAGICGACTVLIDGKAVSSCLVLAVQASGKEVLTIEGLASGDDLHPLQQAFIDHFGFQCGYCTPGMILMSKALLDENPDPTEEEIRTYLAGNICRCTGYQKILESVQAASKTLRGR